MNKLSKEEALRSLGGSADRLRTELKAFAETAKVFSADHPRLSETHRSQWVAVYGGRLVASSPRFEAVMAQLQQQGIAAEKAVVRFIEKDARILIL